MISRVSPVDPDQSPCPPLSLQHALDAAQLGSWQYDPFRRVFSFDARCKEILGVVANRATLEEFMSWFHPDDAARAWACFYDVLNPGEQRRYGAELRIRRGDGEVRWVHSLGLAYFEGDGRDRRAVSVAATLADITERKEYEEKLDVLMREVNHRARNMLGVVDAIAHQSVVSNPEDYVERFTKRIRALAAYQDLLVESEWQGVEIGDLARAQLELFADLIGSRIVMRGAKLRLSPASAQAIGLALHELVTNAAQYGALSRDTGRIDIGWGTDGDTLTISWTERDGPPVSPPKRRGFGSTVMKTMGEQTVDGKVDLDYAPSGVTWRLTCPAANALRRTS
jgi:PAS domain S-box-containing protein